MNLAKHAEANAKEIHENYVIINKILIIFCLHDHFIYSCSKKMWSKKNNSFNERLNFSSHNNMVKFTKSNFTSFEKKAYYYLI